MKSIHAAPVEIRHALTSKDKATIAALRTQLAPLKGKMDGPQARGTFDEVNLRSQDPRNPLASPLYGGLTGLPPIQLHVGTSEVLLDDALRYAERARAEGVDATAHAWEGMTHVFPSSVGSLDAADQALDIMAAFLVDKLGAVSQRPRGDRANQPLMAGGTT
jgi:acetyl esterase/lipase